MNLEALQKTRTVTPWQALAQDKSSGNHARATQQCSLDIQRFLAQPKCIIAEICGWLFPEDLLALARTTRQLRSVFMSKESVPCWAAARRSLGLPHWPAISEPAYATLIFEATCQSDDCSMGAVLTCDAIFVRGRFCPQCAKYQLPSRDEIQVLFGGLPVALVCQLPVSKHRANTDGTLETGRFHKRNDVLKLWLDFQGEISQGFTKQSPVQRLMPDLKAAKKENSIVADQVWAWFKQYVGRRYREAGPDLARVWRTLKGRGWTEQDYPSDREDWTNLLTEILNTPPKTDKAWLKTISSFEKILHDHKSKVNPPARNARPFALESKGSSTAH